MGPSIVLDKSSLQTLSASEISVLNRLYTFNIVPVLVTEILADLKKDKKDDRTPEQEVVQLANKLSQMDSAINENYMELIRASLIGNAVLMDRRPVVGGGRFVKSPEGKIGIVYEETQEELAILRWQDSLFNDAEHAVAERWRQSTRRIDLEGFKRGYRASEDFQNIASLEQLVSKVNLYLKRNDSNTELLKMIVTEFGFDQPFANRVFLRWEGLSMKSVKLFAPYALYCFKANLTFYLGLIGNLLGTRPTNRVDLEYVYYLPFCTAFSSKDNFHKVLVPLFLEPNQRFISGEVLKADLSKLRDDEFAKNLDGPLQDKNSPTYEAWKAAIPNWEPTESKQSKKYSLEESRKIAQDNEFLSELPEVTDPEVLKNLDETKIDFMIRKRSVRLSDPCPCKSGKKFRDCHWTPDMKTISR